MFKDNATKNAVYTGIISSAIFLVFFQKILEQLSKFLYSIASSFFHGLLNTFIREAASGFSESYSLLILIMIMATGCTIGAFYLAKLLLRKSERSARPSSLIKNSDKRKKSKFAFRIFTGLYIFLYGSYIVVRSFLIHEMITTYQQKMTIIAPFIDDQTEEELKSQWAQMKNKIDFDEINMRLQEIANTQKIKLPKNLF